VATWKLVGQTVEITHLNDSYQFKLYRYTDDIYTAATFKITSDFRLTRGDSLGKSKRAAIVGTKIEFMVIDKGRVIYEDFENEDVINTRGEIFKNGSIYFRGFISIYLTSKKIYLEDEPLKITIFDGFDILKKKVDLGGLTTGRIALSEITREILNELNLSLNLKVLSSIAPLPNGGVPDNNLFQITEVRVSDFINTLGKCSYYEILESICNVFDITLFQHNGEWVFRQNIAMTTTSILGIVINYSTGLITPGSYNVSQSFATTDLIYGAKYYQVDKLNAVEHEVPVILKKEHNDAGWLNPAFYEGSRGWTVSVGGSTTFTGKSCIVHSGTIEQTSTYSFKSGQTVKIEFKTLSCRWLPGVGYSGSHNAVTIIYQSGGYDYYLQADYSWAVGSAYDFKVFVLTPYDIADHIADYYWGLLEKDIETTIPGSGLTGNILVILKSGAAPVNNDPYEISAQHIFCDIYLKTNADDVNLSAPQNLLVRSVGELGTNVETIEIPFHDDEGLNGVEFYNGANFSKTKKWEPGTLSLLKLMSQKLIKFSLNNMRAYDVTFAPGMSANTNFDKLLNSNINGEGTKYFLPVYESSELIKDIRRFKIIEHAEQSATITTYTEYEL